MRRRIDASGPAFAKLAAVGPSSGNAEAMLTASGYAWHLPAAVQSEIKYSRQHDPAQAGKTMAVPVDLSGLIGKGVLTLCAPRDQRESDRFVHYATVFRSDDESMCLAIAEMRGWTVATDDRKAIRVAKQGGITVVSSPELVKAWADATRPDQATLGKVLRDIQTLAQFKPNATMPEYKWWVKMLAKAVP